MTERKGKRKKKKGSFFVVVCIQQEIDDTVCMVDQTIVTNERYSTPLDIHVIGLETLLLSLCVRVPVSFLMDNTLENPKDAMSIPNGRERKVVKTTQSHSLDAISSCPN